MRILREVPIIDGQGIRALLQIRGGYPAIYLYFDALSKRAGYDLG